jgi:hypothetical protein
MLWYTHGPTAVSHTTMSLKYSFISCQPMAIMRLHFLHCSIQTSTILSYSELFLNTDPSRVILSLRDQVPVTPCSCDHSVNSHSLRVLSALRECSWMNYKEDENKWTFPHVFMVGGGGQSEGDGGLTTIRTSNTDTDLSVLLYLWESN